MLRRLLETLKANLIYVVVGALVTGLAFGQVAGESTRGLRQTAVVPVLVLMIYPMMINIDLDEIRNLRAHVRPVALSLVVNFLFTPFVAVLWSQAFFSGSVEYTVGLYSGQGDAKRVVTVLPIATSSGSRGRVQALWRL